MFWSDRRQPGHYPQQSQLSAVRPENGIIGKFVQETMRLSNQRQSCAV